MSLTQWTWLALALLGASLWLPGVASAQGNFEIQVYGSETVEPDTTMFELHSNIAVKGTTTKEDGIFPTQHAGHETIEMTRGFTPWFETGFYIFTSIQPDAGWKWVGDHIRPRIRGPERWQVPVGRSLSREHGDAGGYAATGISSTSRSMSGYQRLKMALSSPFSVRTRVCNNKCAPSLDHCICCFLQKRVLTTSFTVDSTNPVAIGSPLRYLSP